MRLDQPRREGPEDLAGALPVPPGAREAEAPAWARGEPVAYASATSPEEVAAFYREALLASGWALDGVTERAGRLILVLSTPSLRSPLALRRVTIAVEGAPGGSRFAVWERHAPL